MTFKLCVRLSGSLVLALFCFGVLAPGGFHAVYAGDWDAEPGADLLKHSDPLERGDSLERGDPLERGDSLERSDPIRPTERFEEDSDDANPFGDDRPGLPPERVDKAIRRGVTWLKGRQRKDGSWGGVTGNQLYDGSQARQGGSYEHPAGLTSLALLALLKCKVQLNDPAVIAGFKYLREKHELPGGSYETSMLLMALVATGNASKSAKGDIVRMKAPYQHWAQRVANHLVKKRTALGWRYQVNGRRATVGGEQDLSSTQLAALALFAARRATIRIKKTVWTDIINYTLSQQEATGPEIQYPLGGDTFRTTKARGFAYILGQEHSDEGQPTGGMTAGALANLQIARHALSDDMSERGRKKWDTNPLSKPVQTAIYEALAWMHVNWKDPLKNPGKRERQVYHYYWLYSFERAMDLCGLELLGKRMWYVEMGRPLLESQFTEGYWNSRSSHRPSDVLDTCFALLFLRRSNKTTIHNPQVTPGEANPRDNR